MTGKGIPTGDNYSRYNNPEVTRLLNQAREETNEEQRLALYYKAQEIIRNDAPILVTQVNEQLDVVSKNVNGFWVTAGGTAVFNDITLN